MGRRARALAWILLAFAGCNKGPAATTSPAEKPHVEADLSRTSISDKQYQSLEIKTQPAGHEEAQAERACTAFVTARPEDSVTIAAPVPGVINAARKTAFPVPGQKLSAGTKMLELQPVVSPLDEVQLAVLKRGFESEFKKAEEKVKVVASEVKRLKELVDQKLRGKPDLEDAEARLNQAKEDVSAAEYKLNLFQKDKKAGLELPALSIDSPQAGAIVAVHVSPGQYVPAATPLVSVMNLDQPWLRVLVPEADLERVDRTAPLALTLAGEGKTDKKLSVTATPVAVVPEVDRLKHTVTLLYSFKRPAGAALAKDQLLSVGVPLDKKKMETVVPYSAIVFDAYGGSWVYLHRFKEGDKTHIFERRRVELGPSLGERIVVRPPLEASDQVVVNGAGVLFSREFHSPPVAK